VQHSSARKFTSGRSRLVAVTGRVIRNHPIVGVGVGAQPVASRLEAARRTAATRNASHTTPLTVAAELGAVGFLSYLAFLGGAFGLLQRLAQRQRVLATSLAAIFFTLIVHSLFYSGFFEDPIVWGVVAVAAAATLTTQEVELR
jgi:O-antigen ligase